MMYTLLVRFTSHKSPKLSKDPGFVQICSIMSSDYNAFDVFESVRPQNSNGKANLDSEQAISVERQVFNAASRNLQGKLTQLLSSHINCDTNMLVNGYNAMHIASKKGYAEIVNILLIHPNTLSSCKTAHIGQTALHIAAQNGFYDIVCKLCTHLTPENIAMEDDKGNNALHYASWGGFLDCVRYLVSNCNLSVSSRNHEGLTPIQLAAAGNHHEVVVYLLSMPSFDHDHNITIAGINPLHRAASHGSVETVENLLRISTYDIDATAENGNTALHFAVQHGHMAVVRILCSNRRERCADPGIQNEYGLTPLHYACIQ